MLEETEEIKEGLESSARVAPLIAIKKRFLSHSSNRYHVKQSRTNPSRDTVMAVTNSRSSNLALLLSPKPYKGLDVSVTTSSVTAPASRDADTSLERRVRFKNERNLRVHGVRGETLSARSDSGVGNQSQAESRSEGNSVNVYRAFLARIVEDGEFIEKKSLCLFFDY